MSQLPVPTFSPNGGFCSSAEAISIKCSVPGCVFYYTRNGTEPVPGQTGTEIYDGANKAEVLLDGLYPTTDGGILKAIATNSGYENSLVATSQLYYYYDANPFSQYICSYITKAVGELSAGDKTVTLYYSFVLPGVKIENVISRPLSMIAGITAVQFKQAVVGALNTWKTYFESIFKTPQYGGQLTFNFEPAPNSINGGEEVNNSILLNANSIYTIPNDSGAGDIRFAVADLGNDDGLLLHSKAGHVIINGALDTVLDGQATGGTNINLDFVLLHKLGHMFGGLIDDKNGNFAKLMACKWTTLPAQQQNPAAYNLGVLFPNGLVNDTPWEKLMIERRHTALAPIRPIIPMPVFEPKVSAIAPGTKISFSIPYGG